MFQDKLVEVSKMPKSTSVVRSSPILEEMDEDLVAELREIISDRETLERLLERLRHAGPQGQSRYQIHVSQRGHPGVGRQPGRAHGRQKPGERDQIPRIHAAARKRSPADQFLRLRQRHQGQRSLPEGGFEGRA